MATRSGALQALVSLVTVGAPGNEAEILKLSRQISENRTAAVTTTTAIAEFSACRARQKCRVVGVRIIPDAAVTGAATNFFTVLLAKRPASAPGTPVNLVTYAADTPTTDDMVAFGVKNLLADATLATYVPTALSADFELLEDDVLTWAVTKAGTGMTFPAALLQIALEPRT